MMKRNNANNPDYQHLAGKPGRAVNSWLTDLTNDSLSAEREAALRQKSDEILADSGLLELRRKLIHLDSKKRSAERVRRGLVRAGRYAAAVAVAALVTAALYLIMRPGSSPEELLLANYARYELQGAVRSAETTDNTLMQDAMASYNAREYEKAIVCLEQLIDKGQKEMEPVFMHGMANMEIKNYQQASGSFRSVIDHNDNLYLEDASWYLGLCYMMTDNREKAVTQFEAIAASGSRYAKKAARLARRMR